MGRNERCRDQGFDAALRQLKPSTGVDMKIGEWEITEAYGDKEKNFAIYHESGEGGDFPKDEFASVIAQFYKEHF